MASLIVPRPIALVTTLGANGIANAAPFSMFNMLGEDPPIVMRSWRPRAASSSSARVQWLHARDGLVDTAAWRVRLQDHHPVGRFGASFYVTTRDRFAIDGEDRESRASTPIDEI
jgi:hypothetical protein